MLKSVHWIVLAEVFEVLKEHVFKTLAQLIKFSNAWPPGVPQIYLVLCCLAPQDLFKYTVDCVLGDA